MEAFMKLSIQERNGIPYAKVPGKSIRRDGKIVKEGVIYLGRVIDLQHNVFFNKERGIFTYDPDSGIYGKADASFVSDLKNDGRKAPRLILDFGDAYFLHSLIAQTGYSAVIDSIKYGNPDTLHSMVLYYVLSNSANCHAGIWQEGSYASVLYPKANLTSQRLSDFLPAIGKPENRIAFFDAHSRWVKCICDDPATLIDSTGLPNNIHFPLTAVSNHNGRISREVRMHMLVQRDTGYPLLFRVTPGNIVDVSTIIRTINEAVLRDLKIDFVSMDAGFFTPANVEELYASGIDFITRVSPKYTLYKEAVKNHGGSLRRQENLVKYNDRYVYIKRLDCMLGTGRHEGFAYLGYDVDRASGEAHKVLKRARKSNIRLSELHQSLEQNGYFMLASSLPFDADGILPAYYTRQLIEQYFDIGKGSSKLTPLRVHSEDALYGHLILSMIAATLNIYIQNKMHTSYDNREAVFMALRNQKCMVQKNTITTWEPQANAGKYYNAFGIKCPVCVEKTSDGLSPKYHVLKDATGM